MTNLLDLSQIVTTLQSQCPLFAGRVYETIETNDAALEMFESPSAMVYLSSDASGNNLSISNVVQEHTNGISIKIVVRKSLTPNDLLNNSDAQQIRLCRQQVLAALLGMVPVGAQTPLLHQSGQLTEKNRYLLWTDLFNTDDFLTTN